MISRATHGFYYPPTNFIASLRPVQKSSCLSFHFRLLIADKIFVPHFKNRFGYRFGTFGYCKRQFIIIIGDSGLFAYLQKEVITTELTFLFSRKFTLIKKLAYLLSHFQCNWIIEGLGLHSYLQRQLTKTDDTIEMTRASPKVKTSPVNSFTET